MEEWLNFELSQFDWQFEDDSKFRVSKPKMKNNNKPLVGGFNPFEKYARQNGNLPQIGVKTKNL